MRERLRALLALGAISLAACRAEKSISPVLPSPENNNRITVCKGQDPLVGKFELRIRHESDVDIKEIDSFGVEVNCGLTPEPTATPTPSGV